VEGEVRLVDLPHAVAVAVQLDTPFFHVFLGRGNIACVEQFVRPQTRLSHERKEVELSGRRRRRTAGRSQWRRRVAGDL
jgi:hypothetical protein